ncbi:MAG: nucleotidyl transferase AbiEii/AbiGii toxin family protein [Planctomycetota bacterium]
MTPPIERPATTEGLFLWVMHRFAEIFGHRAILKGGMALRLFDCPRSTTDIDYVFVPHTSKKEIEAEVQSALQELEDATVDVKLHSTMLRAIVALDEASIQVEASVDVECESEPVATASFAAAHGQPSRVVRVMSGSHALAHKLAAWNERRLHRDLYDAYFLRTRLGWTPDRGVLESRLGEVRSRLPALRSTRTMSLDRFAGELRKAAEGLDEDDLLSELAALLPPEETAGLAARLRATLVGLADGLDR